MGYAQSIPFAIQNIRSTVGISSITLSTLVTTGNVQQITIPTFRFPISYAYLDLVVEYWNDTSGALNYIDGGTFGIKTTAGVYHSSSSLGNTLYIEANGSRMGTYVIPGLNNLASYISPGNTQDIAFNAVTCHANNLIITNAYWELHLYFNT